MKKIITLFFTLIVAYSANSQVLLSEDFETAFPSNFTLYDVDGNTVNTNIDDFFPNAWNRLRYSGTTDFFAASTSLYTPAGTSNDWMVTPALNITAGNFYLIWEGRSANINDIESYEVLVSTTGNAVADFTTVLTTVSAETVEWNLRSEDLSAYQDSTIYIAFRNTSTDKFILGIDDIVVRSVEPLDASISEITTSEIQTENSAVTVEGVVFNNGSSAITSLDVNYTVNGGTTVSQNLTGLNIAPFTEYAFTMNSTYNATNAGGFTDLKVWVSNPNGGVDADLTNDSLDKEIFVQNGLSVSRNVLLEEFTTVPCGWCPGAAIAADYILENVPNTILVGLHACFGSDAMTVPEATTLCSDIGPGSAPSGMVDRVLFEGEAQPGFSGINGFPVASNIWTTRARSRTSVGSPVELDIEGTYLASTRTIDVDVKSSFVDFPLPGDISVSLMIVEDSVTGSGSGYAQRNFYNTNPNFTTHPYYGVGDPLNGYNHRHVLRDVLPTTYGDASVIPSTIALNTSYDRNFTATLANGFDENQVYLVAVVGYRGPDLDKYEVLNSFEIKLTDILQVGINENNNSKASIEIYPNPSNTIANVAIELAETNNIQLDVMDITGKVIMTDDLGVMAKGSQLIQVNVANLANGFYFLNLRVGDEIITRKITVAK